MRPPYFLGGVTMIVDEIFNQLASHMKQGIQYHEEMAKAYNFLGLYGYAKCQFSHQLEETKSYQCLLNYYSNHYHKLIKLENFNESEIIPTNWYKYTTIAVDGSTRKNAVKDLMNKWIEWERSTKQFYENMRQELIDIKEIAAALYIENLILDVTKELCHAEKKLIKLESVGYDLVQTVIWAEEMEDKYKKKLGW